MSNPILNLLGQANPITQNLGQVIQTLKAVSNPLAALQNMAYNDPRMQNVLNVINQNGGDPKRAFYAMAQQQGVDPNTVLQQAQQFGNFK